MTIGAVLRLVEEPRLLTGPADRIGLAGVLADLGRHGRRVRHRRPPGELVAEGFALDLRDSYTPRWWPQGITSSADHDPSETFLGQRLLLTSSYAKTLRGANLGTRITVFDVTEPDHVRYRHVRLVDPAGAPLRVHAGGIVWHGPYLHVGATARGLIGFHVDDVAARGGELVWPYRLRYAAQARADTERLRYSFLSLDHASGRILVGEYGKAGQTTRLFRYDMDPTTRLVVTDADGIARPEPVDLEAIPRMQGAALAGGLLYVTQSNGRAPGRLWTGPPGGLVERAGALPPYPEDLTYWPSTGRLWSLSEWPGGRYVYSVDVASLRG